MTTHHQLLYHIVFSTKNRRRWLTEGFRDDVFAYMAGIVRNLGGQAMSIGGFLDHAHLLIRIPARIAVSDFVGKLKANTSKHINDTSGLIRKFGWQDGYGAFTVSVSQKSRIIRYIENQVAHHSNLSFQQEYLSLLEKHEVEYDSESVWD